MKNVLMIVGWIACGLAGAGFFNAMGQNKKAKYWDEDLSYCKKWAARDQSFNLALGAFGPIALVASLAISGFGYEGWRISRKECKK